MKNRFPECLLLNFDGTWLASSLGKNLRKCSCDAPTSPRWQSHKVMSYPRL